MGKQDSDMIPGGSKLTLKPRETETPPPIRKPEEPKRKRIPAKPKKKKPAAASGKFGMRFLGQSIGSFLVALLLLGAFLYHQATGLELLTPHQAALTRGIVVVSFLVILTIEAFTEDMMQGILCVFLTPYIFVYGLLFADAGPIRGITTAMLVFLGAEMYFTPERALVPAVTRTINGWIQEGQDRLIYPDGRPEAGFENR